MDPILNPEVIWIGKRCYRKMPVREEPPKQYDYGWDYDEDMKDDEPVTCGAVVNCEDLFDKDDKKKEEEFAADDLPEVFKDHEGYKSEILVPDAYRGFLIGKGCQTIKRIERETHTRILRPSAPKDNDMFKVLGKTTADVRSALLRMKIMMDAARQRERPTHFIGVPMNGPEVQKRYLEFRKQALQACRESQGMMDGCLFQHSDRLHLTIGMLALMHTKERERAAQMLKEYCKTYLQPLLHGQKLSVRLRGLEIMNDDPSAVSVLYAKVVPDESSAANCSLESIANDLMEYFIGKGIMKGARQDHVKVHVTLLNTRWSDPSSDEDAEKGSTETNPKTFDARKILELFKNFDFGVHVVESIRLSQMHSTKSDNDGYYNSIEKVDL